MPEDKWNGHGGFIHEVVLDHYLRTHPQPTAVEYHLGGPPMMVKASTKMLTGLGVSAHRSACDEFKGRNAPTAYRFMTAVPPATRATLARNNNV